MCKPKISVEDDYLRRVDENQSPEIVRIRLEVMSKNAARCERELRESEERHECERNSVQLASTVMYYTTLLR